MQIKFSCANEKKLESHFIQECRLSKLYSEAGQVNSTEETEKTFKGLERNFNGKFFQNNNDNDNSNLGRPTDILNFPNYVILVRTPCLLCESA